MNMDLQRGHNRMRYLLPVLIVWGQLLLSDAIDDTAPETTLIGIHHQSIVLGCRFATHDGFQLENLIITWQRVEHDEVVHSYYYGKDQTSHQSEQYSGRTSLFPEEFKHGNASLKLEGVRAEDAGQYICFVSTISGSAEETVFLNFAAYYKDTQLLIKLQPSSTTFILESQGYPEASVLWYCAEDKNVLLKPHTSFVPREDGLYSLRSVLEVDHAKTNCNHIVEINNILVNQTVTRKFNLLLPRIQENNTDRRWCIALGSCLLVFAAIIVLILVIYKHQERKAGEKTKPEFI
ncbi:CD276 antigen-like [Scyliorhinus canicula]|uniref:CD276 antigen-like n=1 Tax=Scyliorhinus canicula TaxID=7830 RepID=UPI0018F2FB94|nr:CD276 antigen-like [Scyliorhinus canicula]